MSVTATVQPVAGHGSRISQPARSFPINASLTVPEDQERLRRDAYQAGVAAAENGRQADSCPFPTGLRRKQWLAGFFSGKPLLKKPCCQHE
jgi:ribosome modulation factor